MAEIYNLISCNTGTHPSILGLYSNFTLPDNNKIISLPSQPTQYYTLVFVGSGSTVGHSPIPSYTVTDFNDCGSPNRERYELKNCSTGEIEYMEFNVGDIVPTNSPCGCPSGYFVNSSTGLCEQILTQPATNHPTSPVAQFTRANTETRYGINGVNIYENIDPFTMPLDDDPPDFQDASSTYLVKQTIGNFWRNTSGTEGRLNDVGLNTPVVNEWVGFTKCMDIEETGKYCFGVGGNHEVKVRINGEEIISFDDPPFGEEQWHVFEVTLYQGKNIFEVEAKHYTSTSGAFGFEFYKAELTDVLGWTSLSELNDAKLWDSLEFDNTDVFIGSIMGWYCPTGYAVDYCEGGDYPVCTLIRRESNTPCVYPIIRTNERPCDCFQVLAKTTVNGQHNTIHSTLPACETCTPPVDATCPTMERTLSYAMFLKMPESTPNVQSLFKECCYLHKIFASTTDSNIYKNDFSGMYHQRQVTGETVEFILKDLDTSTEYVLNNSTYGVFKSFTSILENPNLSTFIVDWRKVLVGLGAGNYTLFKRITLFSLVSEVHYLIYYLNEFSESAANGTARIDVGMSGLLEREGVDFTGSGFVSSLRVPGFFGRRETKWEEDNIVNEYFEKDQVSMKQTNEYKFQTNLIPCCLTEYINDFLLFSGEIKMNDYNQNNHCYKFRRFDTKLADNDGTGYLTTSRKARLNLLFSDKKLDNNKRNY